MVQCTGGERILETLWKPQMPWIVGFGASQPYSRGERPRKRSESVSGVFPEFFRNFFRKVPAVLGVWPNSESPELIRLTKSLNGNSSRPWPEALENGCKVRPFQLQSALKKRGGNASGKLQLHYSHWFELMRILSGPLNRLNAILSLVQPLDRYRTPSAIGSAIGRPLCRPISHPNTGGSPQPPRSKPLGGLNRAIVLL